jgi:hypothetical protein
MAAFSLGVNSESAVMLTRNCVATCRARHLAVDRVAVVRPLVSGLCGRDFLDLSVSDI